MRQGVYEIRIFVFFRKLGQIFSAIYYYEGDVIFAKLRAKLDGVEIMIADNEVVFKPRDFVKHASFL